MIPEEMDDIFRKFNLVKSGQAQKFRCRVQTLKNKERTWIITYMPITVNRAVTGIYALINDITENVAEELELEKSLRDLKKILDASLDILCVLNIKGEFVRINKHRRIMGIRRLGVSGKRYYRFCAGRRQKKNI